MTGPSVVRPARTATALLVMQCIAMPLLFAPSIARADDATCIDANERSIALRRDGKLRAAMRILVECTDPACPTDVKEACVKRIAKVDEATPSLVFAVKNGAGDDVTDVTVTMDGAPLLGSLDGRPVALDPGSHTFVFTARGQLPVERTLVIHEGEKNRQETVRVGPGAPPPEKPPPPAPPPSTTSAWSTQRYAGVVIAGVGVIGLGLGAAFGLVAIGEQSNEKKDCSSSACPNPGAARTEYDGATRDAAISTVSFIAGGALTLGGTALFFLAKPSADASASTAGDTMRTLRLAPSVDARSRGFVLRGEF